MGEEEKKQRRKTIATPLSANAREELKAATCKDEGEEAEPLARRRVRRCRRGSPLPPLAATKDSSATRISKSEGRTTNAASWKHAERTPPPPLSPCAAGEKDCVGEGGEKREGRG